MTRKLVADFETTVYEGQERTDVWSAGFCELYTEDVVIVNSIKKFFTILFAMRDNITLYYHNLKFDGSFIIDYLMIDEQYTFCYSDVKGFIKDKDMPKKSFKTLISDRGQWYSVTIKTPYGNIIKICDSLKLIPTSLDRASKSFDTRHKKLDMCYEGYRKPNGTLSEDEVKYLKHDVLVLKELMEVMLSEGHDRLTIGSCCLAEFKKTVNRRKFAYSFNELFPDLRGIKLETDKYCYDNADEYIRKSYRGGWCHLKKGCATVLYHHGCTIDFNSMYPSKMHSSSGCKYPVGNPLFFKGNIPDKVKNNKDLYYFVRFKCRFKLKKGYLPFVQIKDSFLYPKNVSLETSDVYDKANDRYLPFYPDKYGNLVPSTVTLTMTCVDFDLFLTHYNVYDLEILDGCYFYTQSGMFDDYIDKYKDIKMTSTGAKREIAKLYLNNLYGKLGTSPNSSYKIPYINNKGYISFKTIVEFNKKTLHVATASAITSYARYECITSAQKNYDNFIYADTDSLHLNCTIDRVKGVKIHPTKFNHWALECEWYTAWFVRQKTYIECYKDKKGVNKMDVKCAGMPDRCKDLFRESCGYSTDIKRLKPHEKDFIVKKRDITDFKVGIVVPSKLVQTRIKGGVVLKEDVYTMDDINIKQLFDKNGNLKERV